MGKISERPAFVPAFVPARVPALVPAGTLAVRLAVVGVVMAVAGCSAAAPQPAASGGTPTRPASSAGTGASSAGTTVSAASPRATASSPAGGASSGTGTPGTAGTAGTPGTADTTRAPLGSSPPAWLGTRPLRKDSSGFGVVGPTPPELVNRQFTLPDTAEPLDLTGFHATIEAVPPDVVKRSTWHRGCPVSLAQLRYVRVVFHGFDGQPHTGELLVHRAAAADIVAVFRALHAARFPIEEMRVTRTDEQSAAPTGDTNNTGAFACRTTRGSSIFSQHAYGLALDINPFQNPYRKGAVVLPELASAYLDRSRTAPGMIHRADVVQKAFADIGWSWGGDWHSLKDYQHFSRNGR